MGVQKERKATAALVQSFGIDATMAASRLISAPTSLDTSLSELENHSAVVNRKSEDLRTAISRPGSNTPQAMEESSHLPGLDYSRHALKLKAFTEESYT